MRKMSSRLMVLATATAVFVAVFGTLAVTAAFGVDIEAHYGDTPRANAVCIGCHGQKALESSLDPAVFPSHKRHLYSAFLRFQSMEYGCTECHACVDLCEGSGASPRRQVDVGLCVDCHGVFTSAIHGSDLAATQPRGCTVCHSAGGGATDPVTAHAAVDYVNKFYTRSRTYCTKCHGGIDFYPIEETNL